MALQAWKGDQIEVADFIFANAEPQLPSLQVDPAERLAETLYEVGRGFLLRKDLSQSSKWLGRALAVVDSRPMDQLSREGVELRISIVQGIVEGLLQMNTDDSLRQVDGLISCLENDIGDRPVVLLMRLELIQQVPQEAFDPDMYALVLKRMVRAFISKEASFKLILLHIKRLGQRSYYQARAILDGFLETKLLGAERHAWAEKGVITRIWMTTAHSDDINEATELRKLFDTLIDGGMILGPEAAMAGQSVSACSGTKSSMRWLTKFWNSSSGMPLTKPLRNVDSMLQRHGAGFLFARSFKTPAPQIAQK